MAGIEVKSLSSPEEVRAFEANGHADVVALGSGVVMRGVFEPGWVWSKHVGPIAGTKSCQAPHLLYFISGRMKVVMDDGTEAECGAGDVVRIEPGHDAWIVGDETCEVIDFGGFESYAKPS